MDSAVSRLYAKVVEPPLEKSSLMIPDYLWFHSQDRLRSDREFQLRSISASAEQFSSLEETTQSLSWTMLTLTLLSKVAHLLQLVLLVSDAHHSADLSFTSLCSINLLRKLRKFTLPSGLEIPLSKVH
jgi:hypothetical protein